MNDNPDLRERHPGSARVEARPQLRAGARFGRSDGDEDTKMICAAVAFCIVLLFLVFGLIVGILYLRHMDGRAALSDDCDDGNPCTYDFTRGLPGLAEDCCEHCQVANAVACDDECYDDATCSNGECKGTCRGLCSDFNALDCPKIRSVNLTDALGLGDTGNDLATSWILYQRSCEAQVCLYAISASIANETYARSNFAVQVARLYEGNSTNAAYNSSSGLAIPLGSPSDEWFNNMLCLPFIADEDRGCLRTFYASFTQTTTAAFTFNCKFVFACVEPPSYSGSVAFPVAGEASPIVAAPAAKKKAAAKKPAAKKPRWS
jgi:hypothetical protein